MYLGNVTFKVTITKATPISATQHYNYIINNRLTFNAHIKALTKLLAIKKLKAKSAQSIKNKKIKQKIFALLKKAA